MIVTIDHVKYSAKFRYLRGNWLLAPLKDSVLRHGVVCYISSGPENLSRGRAICHPNDRYDKRVGRKLAFKKAVEKLAEKLTESKTTRKQYRKCFWTSFLTTHKLPQKQNKVNKLKKLKAEAKQSKEKLLETEAKLEYVDSHTTEYRKALETGSTKIEAIKEENKQLRTALIEYVRGHKEPTAKLHQAQEALGED